MTLAVFFVTRLDSRVVKRFLLNHFGAARRRHRRRDVYLSPLPASRLRRRVHALLIYAMFDVHFLTPLVHGMEPTSADFRRRPRRRLVVIVADGLRADRLFELEDRPRRRTLTPRAFPARRSLHRVAREDGPLGQSATPGRPRNLAPGSSPSSPAFTRTRAPSRRVGTPTPWSSTTLLNQSSAAWAIGAPSVVPLFASGIAHVRARACTPTRMEDFAASSDHAALDECVLDRTIQEVLRRARLPTRKRGHGRTFARTPSARRSRAIASSSCCIC